MDEIIIRVDGRGFTKFTNKYFDKPFDKKFSEAMTVATYNVMKNGGMPIIRAYTQSDEASFLLHPETNCFGRRTEKIASVMSGLMTRYFAIELMKLNKIEAMKDASFDGKVFVVEKHEVEAYFDARYHNSINNYMMQWSHFNLKKLGWSGKRINDTFKAEGGWKYAGIKLDFLNQIAYGTEFRKERILKKTINQLTGDDVVVERSHIFARAPVRFDEHRKDYNIARDENYN